MVNPLVFGFMNQKTKTKIKITKDSEFESSLGRLVLIIFKTALACFSLSWLGSERVDRE